jgi:hypothetical protein
MKKKTLIAAISAAFAVAAGLVAQDASALICCSACYPGNPYCRQGCNPSCAQDEGPAAPTGGVYDETAALCYAE